MKALLSVYDKTGILDFARALQDNGFDLVSTGGTSKILTEDSELLVRQVSDLTGCPESLDGRVKTLHPSIHAGILARRDISSHLDEISRQNIDTIDLVAVNLYPFVDTVTNDNVTLSDALENIDIGGPTLIRAAAKNFPFVTIVVDPNDYSWVAERLTEITLEERRALAVKAFQHVALYDTAVARYLGGNDNIPSNEITFGYRRIDELRYGENPHQSASVYVDELSKGGVVRARQLHGIEMSYTNILDADAAWKVVSDFSEPVATVVKHTNPCGLAVHADQPTAYRRAFEGDHVSAYGGIVGFNRPVTVESAEAMRGVLYHIIVAPGYESQALNILKRRRETRILEALPETGPMVGFELRMVSGGALFQSNDEVDEDLSSWKVVTDRQPSDVQMRDLEFAWKAAKHVKSNAIVLAKSNAVVGIGTGQPNRATSVVLALRIAGEKAKGCVLASDAYMPFADNVKLAAEGGVDVVAQPGGSIRDNEVIEAANRLGVSMVFTGVRHFKH